MSDAVPPLIKGIFETTEERAFRKGCGATDRILIGALCKAACDPIILGHRYPKRSGIAKCLPVQIAAGINRCIVFRPSEASHSVEGFESESEGVSECVAVAAGGVGSMHFESVASSFMLRTVVRIKEAEVDIRGSRRYMLTKECLSDEEPA